MNTVEHLFACLAEELNETGQEVGKCLRFSPFHQPPGYIGSNVDRMTLELADVFAIVELLNERGIQINIHSASFRARVEDKKRRTVQDGMRWARDLGALVD